MAAKKKAAKKAASKAEKPAKGKPATKRVVMQETQAGPNVLRLMGREYDVEAAEADRMVAAGICTEA